MDPSAVFCPHLACPDKGLIGQGNIHIHSRADQRYRCTRCGHTFTATTNTPFYRLRHAHDLVTLVLTLLAHGCPIAAIVAAFGLDERTVRSWLHRAGAPGAALHAHLVQDVAVGQVQADEIRARVRGGAAWVALALALPSRGASSAPAARVLLSVCSYSGSAPVPPQPPFSSASMASPPMSRRPGRSSGSRSAPDAAAGPGSSGRRASCSPRSSRVTRAAAARTSCAASWSGPSRPSSRRLPALAAPRSTRPTSSGSMHSCAPSLRRWSVAAAPPLMARPCSRVGCGSSAVSTTGAGPTTACASTPSGLASAIWSALPPWRPG